MPSEHFCMEASDGGRARRIGTHMYTRHPMSGWHRSETSLVAQKDLPSLSTRVAENEYTNRLIYWSDIFVWILSAYGSVKRTWIGSVLNTYFFIGSRDAFIIGGIISMQEAYGLASTFKLCPTQGLVTSNHLLKSFRSRSITDTDFECWKDVQMYD